MMTLSMIVAASIALQGDVSTQQAPLTQEQIIRLASLPAINPAGDCVEHDAWTFCVLTATNPLMCGDDPGC